MIRTIIVDDEPLARELVRTLLERIEDIRIVAECATGVEAMSCMTSGAVDLVFLDIQMPGLSGLDILARLGDEPRPYVVFVTAHDKYAVEAFDVSAVDYILKPIDKARFERAVKRARERLQTGKRPEMPILVRDGVHVEAVLQENIIWVEAANQYACVHTASRTHMISRSLSSLERQLDSTRFVRVHRSALVNVAHVREVKASGNGTFTVLLNGGHVATLSRRRRALLQTLLAAR